VCQTLPELEASVTWGAQHITIAVANSGNVWGHLQATLGLWSTEEYVWSRIIKPVMTALTLVSLDSLTPSTLATLKYIPAARACQAVTT
jgi:hypothetical protein